VVIDNTTQHNTMPGVRWRTVIPLTVAIFTLVALRNLFIYSDHLPTSNSNHESGSSNELIGLIMRRRHVEPDDVADEEPDEDNRRQDVNNVNNVRKRGRQQAVRVNAFQLFPEDEPVKPIANEPQEPSQLLKSDKDVEVRQQPEVFINRRNKEPDDTPDKEENSNVKNARQVEEVDSNKKSKDDADSRQEEEEVNLKPANRDNKIRDMRLSMLNDGNSSMHEDALIMANMGQVGQIVRKMKQTRNDDETDKHDSHSRQYSTVNPHPFEYVINSPKLCADESVFLVVYVHTAPEHYKRRTVIRQTWGDVGQYEVNVKLVFVAGVTAANDDEKMQNALLFEAEQYGDIVQVVLLFIF
jgi:hypothetical protein